MELFFENGQYNSCNATDELIRSIEKSQDEELAKKALDLYQKHLATLDKPWDHVVFMYGLGLVYMHFNAYNWAVKSFREAIYVQPSFAKSRDIHTRLGLIFKSTGRYKLSEKHFNLAINDTRPDSGTSSKLELRFHLAHLYEIQGKLKQANDAYEKLLQEKDLPPSLSANIHRQLGWILYRAGSKDLIIDAQHNPVSRNRKDNMFDHQNMLAQDPHKIEAALNYLNTSQRTHNDSRTSYYLGRCLANVGRFQDAFAAFRDVIDRDESTADTWCSIGVLYHRQNQPWDALQAYIRSVQFDKRHSVAWLNLGLLYESHNQFRDALKCFQHALKSGSNGLDKSLHARIKYIQKQMTDIEAASSSSNTNGKPKTIPDKLLNLEDMWNLESKTNSESHQPASNNKSTLKSVVPKSIEKSEVEKMNNNNNNNNSLDAPKLLQSITAGGETGTIDEAEDQPKHQMTNGPVEFNQKKETLNESNSVSSANDLNKTIDRTRMEDNQISESKKLQSNSHHPEDTTTTTTISTPPLTATTCTTTTNTKSTTIATINQNGLPNHCKLELIPQVDNNNQKQQQQQQPQSQEARDFCLNQAYTNGASKDSGISSNSSTYTDCALVPSQNSDISATTMNYQSAEQISETCKNLPRPRKYDINLLSDDDRPPVVFPQHPPYPPPSSDKLFPLAPTIYLESKKDLTTKKLLEFCQSSPISIVRNIAGVLKLDLGLFSTKTLVESNPSQQIEVISHLSSYSSQTNDANNNNNATSSNTTGEPHDNNSDSTNPTSCWSCEQHLSISTISRYASYQVSSLRESLRDEKETKTSTSTNKQPNHTKESETDSNESALANPNKRNYGQMNSSIDYQNSNSNQHSFLLSTTPTKTPAQQQPPLKKMKKEQTPSKVRIVRTANRIDLSDEKRWRPQLNELNKLPYFIRCVSASNMLTHLGQAVPGINTVVMNMHVPGCRFVGNNTPNNFCPIFINTGPGDYEWFAISGEYERILSRMCQRNGFQLDDQGWWPGWNDFQRFNIPVYKFSQRPGDLVWVNSGTFYWYQASGWTNCIQWNVGPLCARQYRLAAEKFEINKLLFKRSDVPMMQMTWNIVMNINIIADDELFKLIINVTRRSLRYCCFIRDLLEEKFNKKRIIMSSDDEEPGPRYARFCSLCDNEIFNITFRNKKDHGHHHGHAREDANNNDDGNQTTNDIIYCLECARRADETLERFDILQDYDLTYLSKLYDGFIETKKRFQARHQQQLEQPEQHHQRHLDGQQQQT